MTTKYTVSPSCRHEVALAHSFEKPIIPLLLENMAWPPEGAMGDVFKQLLSINLCADVGVQEHFRCSQFEDILHVISQHVPRFDSGNYTPIGKPKRPPSVAPSRCSTRRKDSGVPLAPKGGDTTRQSNGIVSSPENGLTCSGHEGVGNGNVRTGGMKISEEQTTIVEKKRCCSCIVM